MRYEMSQLQTVCDWGTILQMVSHSSSRISHSLFVIPGSELEGFSASYETYGKWMQRGLCAPVVADRT